MPWPQLSTRAPALPVIREGQAASELTWTHAYEAPDDAFARTVPRQRRLMALPEGLVAPPSMREVSGLRSGGSTYLLAWGIGGGILGTLGATTVSIIAILDLLSEDPVYPFNRHGGVHRAPAYALIGCTAGLLIPAGGFVAGALVTGAVGLMLTCLFY